MTYTAAQIKKNQRAWIKRLESGEEKQADSVLVCKSGRGWAHCCLGVALKVLGRKRVRVTNFLNTKYQHGFETYSRGASHIDLMLDHDAMDALGLKTDTGNFNWFDLVKEHPKLAAEISKTYGHHTSDKGTALTTLNDARVPFALIAKVIKASPKGLFKKGHEYT